MLERLRAYDQEIEAQRRALKEQLGALTALCGEEPENREFSNHYLHRLLMLLDHAAHLAKQCALTVEQRSKLLRAYQPEPGV